MSITERFEKYRLKLLEEIKSLTIFHWIRLGICFGLFGWFEFASRMIIAGRVIEKITTIYQLGVIERENNLTIDPVVDRIYLESLKFDAILILVIIIGLWAILLRYFGLPKRMLEFDKEKK